MNRLICLVIGLVAFTAVKAQEPVKWSFSVSKLDDKTYEVHFTAAIAAPWCIYSGATPADGPLPTTFSFNNNPLLIVDGEVKELGKMQKKHEEVFDVDVLYYKEKVTFVQTVKLKTKATTNLSGSLEFMACNNEQCLPPKSIPFSVSLR